MAGSCSSAEHAAMLGHNRLVGGSSPPGPTTTHSRSNGDFLVSGKLPRIGGVVGVAFVSAATTLSLQGCQSASDRAPRSASKGSMPKHSRAVSAPLSLPPKFRFPATETLVRRDWVRMRRLLSWEAEQVVLAGPFHRQVGEARNAHAVREPTLNGSPNEVGCKER